MKLRVFTLLAVLPLSSCGTAEVAPPQETVVVVETISSTIPSEASSLATTVAETTPSPETSKHAIKAGQVGGDCGISAQGDQIHAYPQTSCEFAAAMYDAAITLTYQNKKGASGNFAYSADTTVNSPVTGQPYALRCYLGSDQRGLICAKVDSQNTVGATFHSTNPSSSWAHRVTLVD
ncbi:hypothetical protein CKALI_04695 [Corynebacterium kalinowskii]|uniref:Thiamine biosynthesis protein n=1 Tax=Corynebacterium kalinowskii TaxID=2675216 RepID=A0A6B8VQH8_9CORY|nr:hypothetical protein CKALI_04695 [Corynebacterium kalinowskii]